MIKLIGLPDNVEALKDLFRLAGKDGFREAIVLISQQILKQTGNDSAMLETLVGDVNPAMRPYAMFPFKWQKIIPVLFMDWKKHWGQGFPIKQLKSHLV